ncbi:V-type ATP synthase subunit I, partial [Halobium palmae]
DEDRDEDVGETDADAEQDPQKAVTDGSGGNVVMRNDDPPVVQKNPGVVSPFEVLVKAVGRPGYREFDPTVILFLTFPAFFGFMIGDLGYGLLYSAIGYFLYANYDSPAFKSMGGVTIACGLFTMLFGILYGEIFGLHLIATYLWEGTLGLSSAPLHKGLQPADIYWAQAWLTISVLVALVHLNVGYVFGFFEELEFHGFKAALTEKGSWFIAMNGLWLFVFSRLWANSKPSFLYTVFDGTGTAPEASGEFAGAAFELGFNGFSPVVGWVGLGLVLLGAGLLAMASFAELLEIFDVLVNVLSYTRIAAVLLAKAGMAFAVNLLFFGAYQHDGEFHFMLNHGPDYYIQEYGREAIMFGGLFHGGAAALLGGIVVLLVGHLLVLALGVTSAGLQAVRLEYYEFFSKFFDGGGREYAPFGYDRHYTTED